MKTEDIIKIIVALAPYLIEAGISAVDIVARYQSGATLDEIIAEVQATRNDLPELDFGITE